MTCKIKITGETGYLLPVLGSSVPASDIYDLGFYPKDVEFKDFYNYDSIYHDLESFDWFTHTSRNDPFPNWDGYKLTLDTPSYKEGYLVKVADDTSSVKFAKVTQIC